jgi:hypothetical protein
VRKELYAGSDKESDMQLEDNDVEVIVPLSSSPHPPVPTPRVLVIDDDDGQDYDDEDDHEDDPDDEDDEHYAKDKESSSSSITKKKRRRHRATLSKKTDKQAPSPGPYASDKWIRCPRNQHIILVMPGDEAHGIIPSYADLPDGVTVQHCDEHGAICQKCSKIVSYERGVTCASDSCEQFFCLPCGVGNKTGYPGLWFCSKSCRKSTEHPEVTGHTQPFCAQLGIRGKSNRPPPQDWMTCYTCMVTVCISCAALCHEDHTLGERLHGTRECRCGEFECCHLKGKGDKDAPKARDVLAATREKLALTEEREKIPDLIAQCQAEQHRVNQLRLDLIARVSHDDAELKKRLEDQHAHLKALHDHTGALLAGQAGLTMEGLTSLQVPLVAAVAAIADLTAEKEALPKRLDQTERELKNLQEKHQTLANRRCEIHDRLKKLEDRIKKAAAVASAKK